MGKRRGSKRDRGLTAATADRYTLYQDAVQEPGFDVEFFDRVYRENFSTAPRLLREDFCGTAAISCAWVRADDDHRAFAIDLDEEPLAWCREHNFARLDPAQRERVTLVRGDARDASGPAADVISCQNFSFFIYRTRDELREYFRSACENLAANGILVMDMMGGSEVIEEDREEVTEKDGYDYIWDQHSFDPISSAYTCFIHFRFPDGSSLERAFEYRWRLWTLPEVRELLLEAGFRRADVYWEESDEDGEGNGEFVRVETADEEPAWVSYVIGVK